MRNTLQESLSDHTMDVIVIAHALVSVANIYFGKDLDESRAALLAAFHDAPEIITGDMPTPVKYYAPEVKQAYSKVEEAAIEKMLESLPEEMRGKYASLLNGNDEGDKMLMKYVKAADKISACIKCAEEIKMGNSEFKNAFEANLSSVKEMNIEEADIFISEFLDSYSLPLDELK